MSHHLHLGPALLHRIEDIARAAGMTPEALVAAAVERFESERNGHGPGVGSSAHDDFVDADLIGCVDDGPGDKSVNPKYFEGFGRD